MLTTYQFKGKDLYPFSAARKDALLTLCPGIAEKRIGLFEMKALVFLCSKSYTVCQQAFSAPDALRVKILEWIDAELADETDAEEAVKVGVEILKGAEKHRVVPAPSDTPSVDADLDPNS